MPSTLIPLTKGCTFGQIDHNLPRVMKNPMDKNKWIKFCDRVNAILLPVKIMIWLRLLVFVVSVVLFGLSIWKLQPLQHTNVSHWKHTNTYQHNSNFLGLIVAAGIMLVLVIILSFVIRCLTNSAIKKLEDLCDSSSGKGVDFYVKDKYYNHRIRKQISKLCVEVSAATTVAVSVDTGSSNDSDIEEVMELDEEQYDNSYDIEEVEVVEEEEEEEQSDDNYDDNYDDIESPAEPSQSNNPTISTTTINTTSIRSPMPRPIQSSVVVATAYTVEEHDTFNNNQAAASTPSVTISNNASRDWDKRKQQKLALQSRMEIEMDDAVNNNASRDWDRREQQKVAQTGMEIEMDDVVDIVCDLVVGDIVVEPTNTVANRDWDIREQRKLTESKMNDDDNKNDTVLIAQDYSAIGKVDIISGDVTIGLDNESVVSGIP